MRKLSTVLLIFKILKIPLVVLQMAIIAKYFGVTLDRDIWILSLSLVTVIDTAVWGPVVETFRAKFIFLKEELGEVECLNYTSSFLAYMFLFSFLVSVFLFLFSNDFARIMAPNYDNFKIEYLSRIIRLCIPFLLFNQITMVLISVLNSYDIFKAPEISSFVSVIANSLIIIFTAEYIGIYSLFLGHLFSLLLLLFFIVNEIKKNGINLFGRKWRLQINGFATFFAFALPFFATYFFYNFNLFYEKKLVTLLSIGAVSILDYGSKIPFILNGITTSLTLSIFLPIVTKSYVSKHEIEFNKHVKVYFSNGILLIAFTLNLFAINATEFIKILYYFSDFNQKTYNEIALVSILYTFYILFYFTYLVFGTVLLSTENRKKYVLIGVFTQFLIFILYKFLFNNLGILTFPLSNIVAYLVSTIFLYYNYPFKNDLMRQTRKYFIVIFFSSLLVFFVKYFVIIENIYFSLIFMTLLTTVAYGISSVLLKLDEVKLIINIFKYKRL